MQQKNIQKTKKKNLLQKKACDSYQNLSEEEKNKKRLNSQYGTFFIENKLSEEKENKSVNMLENNMKIFLEKKKMKGANMHVKNIETLLKKKSTKSANMRVNDIESFLKSFNFLQKYNKQGFF